MRDSAGELPLELIHEELQVRMQAGRRVTEEEIHERFPRQARRCATWWAAWRRGHADETYFVETVAGRQAANRRDAAWRTRQWRIRAGQQIDDFQLLTKLGEGAFAQVFLARQVSMERLVALKISSHQGSEPQTLAQLDHANWCGCSTNAKAASRPCGCCTWKSCRAARCSRSCN